MANTKLTFLGTFTGNSKKTGNEFTVAHFYRESTKGRGFESLQLFVDSEVKKQLDQVKPLDPVEADLRFVNGQNILISVSGK